MSGSYISLQANEVDPARLEAVLARQLEYEQIRGFRLLLLPRLGLLLLLALLLTKAVHVLPVAALLGLSTIAAATSGATLVSEALAKQRLARELANLPASR